MSWTTHEGEWGTYQLIIYGDEGGMVYYCYTHITVQLASVASVLQHLHICQSFLSGIFIRTNRVLPNQIALFCATALFFD